MKVILVNGSPHKAGCTYTALNEVAQALNEEGIDTEIFHIGSKPISGCTACGACSKLKKCVFDDTVNEFVEMARAADGFVFGSPVYYGSANGSLVSFLDRAFFCAPGGRDGVFYLKPGAAVCSARRGGTTATFDQLNKYFTISQMPVISSQYWNMVHGNSPEQVKQDLEGLQIMRTLGKNMAWFLKCKQAGQAAGVPLPSEQARVATNFIR